MFDPNNFIDPFHYWQKPDKYTLDLLKTPAKLPSGYVYEKGIN